MNTTKIQIATAFIVGALLSSFIPHSFHSYVQVKSCELGRYIGGTEVDCNKLY